MEGELRMSAVDRAVELCRPIVQYHVSPFKCYYYNPHKYTPVELMKWAQKYVMNRQYMTLIKAANIMGMEPVPYELLMRHNKRDGLQTRNIKVGKVSFWLLREDEMSQGLKVRYAEFKEKMASYLSNSITI
jgi:hypothetical protein